MIYMIYKTYKTNKTYIPNQKGGYQSLIVYWLAVEIYDLTVIFCKKYISKKSRTYDQMIQASRSGKQNIVEASLEPSFESNIKLTGVARASFAELLEDYKDFIRQNNFLLWDKDDSRNLYIRSIKNQPISYKTNRSYKSYMIYKSYMSSPESYANLMVTLCIKAGYLLDKLLKSIQEKFIKSGGFRENLFRKR
ncbi:MAG: four helix bundle suffix domain-containing protein, partial [Patescibacteria group bacterium]|nr:four helix bundle suffix domain-containing protein [Patescibacteria group bacterium]